MGLMGDNSGEWLCCMTAYPLLRTPGLDDVLDALDRRDSGLSLIQHAPHSPGSLLAYLGLDYISEVEIP